MLQYEWKHIGSAAEQEQCLCQATFLGEWSLRIVECGWVKTIPVWQSEVYMWDQRNMEYKLFHKLRCRSTREDHAKQLLEDWYDLHVLVDDIILNSEDQV